MRLDVSGRFLAFLLMLPVCATASDLGSSGPFRSLGGGACSAGAPNACVPQPVDVTLPQGQQVRGHVARALTLIDLLRLEDARAALDDALRLDPDDLQALTLRGRLNLTNGDVGAARTDLERALSLAPGNADILATVAAVSPPEEAQRDLDAALARKPDDVDILFAHARIALGRGDTAAAFADLSRDLALAPDDERSRLLRASIQLRRQDYDLATFDADKVLAARPQDPQALGIKAAARLGAGDDEGAIATYSVLLDGPGGLHALSMPAAREALVNRGRLYAKAGRMVEAKHDLAILTDQRGLQALLQLQLYLHGHGYPNVEITGQRTTAFDTALNGCFGDKECGPNLFR